MISLYLIILTFSVTKKSYQNPDLQTEITDVPRVLNEQFKGEYS